MSQYYNAFPILRIYTLCYAVMVILLALYIYKMSPQTEDNRKKILLFFAVNAVLSLLYKALCSVTIGESLLDTLELAGWDCVAFGLLWLVLYRLPKNIKLRTFFEWYHFAGAILTIVLYFAFALVFNVRASNAITESRIPVTAENTPVHLFEELNADITPDELSRLAAEYGWYIDEWSGADGTQTSYEITVDERIRYRMTESGVWAYLIFRNDENQTLDSAFLFIKTKSGTATCEYDPIAEKPFSAETKSGFGRTQTSETITAQEAIDFMYAAVY